MQLSSLDLPLFSWKLALRFIGPFPIEENISPMRLVLPCTMRIHATFQVPNIKPIHDSHLNPTATPPPPPHLIDGGPAFTVHHLVCGVPIDEGEVFDKLIGRDMDQSSGLGCLHILTKTSSETFMAGTQTDPYVVGEVLQLVDTQLLAPPPPLSLKRTQFPKQTLVPKRTWS